jgi:DNA-binding transcriptional regulator LsrR (DeoR family)
MFDSPCCWQYKRFSKTGNQMRAPGDQIIHKAAWLYYAQGMRQEDIADALGISRGTVVAYLKKARDIGAVSIRVPTGLFREDVLARRIEDHFGLRSVWIIPDGSDGTRMDFNIAAATVFLDLVKPHSKVGLSWGQTIYDLVEAMPISEIEGVSIIQMCGNIGTSFQYRPDYCTLELARRLWAFGENLYAPLVLSTPEMARALRREDTVRLQLERLKNCDMAIFSVGSCTPSSHVVKCGAMTEAELNHLTARGAVGQIAARMIDKNGVELDCDYNQRLIAMDLQDLKAIPTRLCVVNEAHKLDALLGGIAGEYISHLVVTSGVAAGLQKLMPMAA